MVAAGACVVASSVGALVGYGIGHLAWTTLGQALVEIYGQADNFQRYRKLVEDWGLWIIIAKSFAPIPFKFIAIAAGVASMNLFAFTIASVLGRTLHFAMIAVLVAFWGQKFLRLIDKYERWLAGVGVLTVIGIGIAYAVRKRDHPPASFVVVLWHIMLFDVLRRGRLHVVDQSYQCEVSVSDVCTHGVDTGFAALGYVKVAVLGILQGITELMPVSSTAHMRLVPAFLGWPDPGSAFSAAMQLAALAAVVSYFWTDVKDLAANSLSALGRRQFDDRHLRFSTWIVLATVPIGVAGLLMAKLLNTCNSPVRSMTVIGGACVAMALLLAFAEIAARHRRTIEKASLVDAIAVGVAQVGALVPGVSRSGSTLTAALALGFKRDEATRLSFLLGLPAIALAGLKEPLRGCRHVGISRTTFGCWDYPGSTLQPGTGHSRGRPRLMAA